jgi:glycosyltransferase involved in cell wall biosynthesis
MSWSFAHAARHADRVIAISENTKRDIIRYYGTPEEVISVIYPGVNSFYRRLEQTTDIETVLAGYGVVKPFLLHVGGLTENRNIAGMLNALTLLKKNNIRPQLVLVGRPFWGFDLRSLLQSRGLTDDVVHIAYAPNENLRILYNAAEVLLLPSFFEGFGIPVLEAMACGTPVVTSNTSALPEAAGDAGLLVDPREPAAIADAVKRILDNPALKKDLVAKGLERAKRFTWRSTAEQTLKVYHSLADR